MAGPSGAARPTAPRRARSSPAQVARSGCVPVRTVVPWHPCVLDYSEDVVVLAGTGRGHSKELLPFLTHARVALPRCDGRVAL